MADTPLTVAPRVSTCKDCGGSFYWARMDDNYATIRAEYRETRRKLAAHRLAVQKATELLNLAGTPRE